MDLLYKLSDQLSTYYNATSVPVQYFSNEGELIETYGGVCSYCSIFKEACGKFCPCDQSHNHAFKEAKKLGEGYMFSCPAGYVHFAVVVRDEADVVAKVLAGPIAVEYADIKKIDEIIQKFDLSINYRNKLYQNFSAALLVEPYRARYLCKLLSQMIIGLSENEILKKKAKIVAKSSHRKVEEYMELVRQTQTMNSQYDLEKQLLKDVLRGDKEHAKAVLNDMLGRIYFTSANNIDIIKARAIELIALLSRTIVENGGSEDMVYQMTDSSLHDISGVKDLTELSYILLDVLEMFSNAAFSKYRRTEIPALRKALDYIDSHCDSPVCLEEVAEYVSLNPAYFSTLFKREIGINFSNYVTERKMEKAKQLLKESKMPLIDIAMSLGYDNQSYFSSVFKKYCQMTPKEYRFSAKD